MKEKIVVMDYSDCSVNIHTIESDNRTGEQILEGLGYDIDTCYIMFCNDVTINIK